MKYLLIPLLITFSGLLHAESAYRVSSLLDEGERGAYMPEASYDILGASIKAGSLEAVKAKLGDVPIATGQHGLRYMCYLSGPHRVEFSVSHLGFGYEVSMADQTSSQCGTTSKPAVNGMGLAIGMKKSDVISMLGAPSEQRENMVSYAYWVQEQASKKAQTRIIEQGYTSDNGVWIDVYSSIRVRFENEKVSWFSITTTKTF